METLTTVFFYLMSILAISALFGMIFSSLKKSILIWAFILFCALGGIYFLLNMAFVGAFQILVGAAGTLCLIAFLMFLTPEKINRAGVCFKARIFISIFSILLIFLSLLWAIVDNYLASVLDFIITINKNGLLNVVDTIGESIIGNYAVVFEVTAVVILLVIVGTAMVGVFKRNEESR